jgi:hypothetical protein
MEDDTLVKSSFAITINDPVTMTSARIATKRQWTLSHGVPDRHAMDRARQTSKE